MELANTFEFISPERIRIKGTRVGIEVVIEKFLDGASPEEIQRHHPHLTLKQIYATITYYLFNREEIDGYIKAGHKRVEEAYLEQQKNPPPGVKRLIKEKNSVKPHNCNSVTKHNDFAVASIIVTIMMFCLHYANPPNKRN